MKDNKMIAEFMGIENDNAKMRGHLYECPVTAEYVSHLEYHTSWDWLMPVVERIEEMGCEVVITNAECTISGNDCYVESIGKSRRGATYKAVAEFINQYNKNK